jgi:uncharacterized protein YdiU (UPF0061 family)
LNAPLPPATVLAAALPERWHNGFAALPDAFHTRLAPQPLPDPYLVGWSTDLADELGFDPAGPSQDLLEALAGNRVPAGSDPLAAVYAGHQFGVYVPQLGDGRAHLLGGVRGPDGRVAELQLKGSGRTPYSRMGDGRAVLRSSIREFLCSEAMAGLGIPTTRALAVVGSDHPVIRETVETAAVTTRVAPSFVRFGSFEFFYWRQQHEALRGLADYVIDTFYPDCRAAPAPYLAFLEQVVRRTARLIADWQAVGFCHGVMNTDNMSILGLTLDYGPFGFLHGFDAGHICNHSDDGGRYAYHMQPQVAHWNLYCLGQALLPLIGDVDAAQATLGLYGDEFAQSLDARLRAKLGLLAPGDDENLIRTLFDLMQASRTDWTIFWRRLAGLRRDDPAADAPLRDLFVDRDAFDAWARDYRARLAAEHSLDAERAPRMNRVNPKFVLRNHLAEVAIRKARGDDGGPRDFAEVERLLSVLRRPFDEHPGHETYAGPPPDWADGLHLSCSS